MSANQSDHVPDPKKVGHLYMRKMELVWAVRMTKPFAVKQPWGDTEKGNNGDFLVKGFHGEMNVVPGPLFKLGYELDKHHPPDHEPVYEKIFIANEELGGSGEPAYSDLPGNALIEARTCSKCGHTEVKETTWSPVGWTGRGDEHE